MTFEHGVGDFGIPLAYSTRMEPSADTPEPVIERDASRAFKRRLPHLLKIRESELARVHIDVTTAAMVVLTAIVRLKPFGAELQRIFATDTDLIAELQDAALAAWHADALAFKTSDELQAVAAEGYTMRTKLMLWARPLAASGLLPAEQIDLVRMRRSYKGLTKDLHVLAHVFAINWSAVEHQSPLTAEEIDRAGELREQIFAGVVTRRGGLADKSMTPMGLRNRAFTDLRAKYRRIALGVTFIVGVDGDANAITPPLAQSHLKAARRSRASRDTDLSHSTPPSEPVSGDASTDVDYPRLQPDRASATHAIRVDTGVTASGSPPARDSPYRSREVANALAPFR